MEINPQNSSMADYVFPEDITICILTRLPVKSILRFKSVCKPWLQLLSTPEFIKLHHDQFSSDPNNHSFIIHNKQCSDPRVQFSIFNIESTEKEPTILDHYPFAYTQNTELDTVGCCNGLVCISGSQGIALWNPAMKLFKIVSPLKDCGFVEMVSLGLGFDAVAGDFKVVRIVGCRCLGSGKGMNVTSVEMYSVNLDSWITIDADFQFSGFGTKCDLIVNGNPYWEALVDGIRVFVYFDVIELVFKTVSKLILDSDEEEEEVGDKLEDYLELEGYFGVLSYYIVNERIEYLNLWVADDVEQVWIMDCSFGPIELDPDMFFLYWKNGKILGKFNCNDELFLLDLETGEIKVLCESPFSSEVYGYTESLAAYIKGMEKVEMIDGGADAEIEDF